MAEHLVSRPGRSNFILQWVDFERAPQRLQELLINWQFFRNSATIQQILCEAEFLINQVAHHVSQHGYNGEGPKLAQHIRDKTPTIESLYSDDPEEQRNYSQAWDTWQDDPVQEPIRRRVGAKSKASGEFVAKGAAPSAPDRSTSVGSWVGRDLLPPPKKGKGSSKGEEDSTTPVWKPSLRGSSPAVLPLSAKVRPPPKARPQVSPAPAARTEVLEAQAHREISNRTQRVELEAQQWANNTTAQHRADLEQLRAQTRAEIAEVQRSRDDEIQRLERSYAQQLASHSNVNAVHVPIPKTGSGLSTPQTHHHVNPFGTPNSAIDEGRHPLSIPISFRPDPNVGYDAPPGLSHPQTPPPLPSSPPSIVLSQPATPKAQQASSSVTGQQAAEGRRPIFGAEGVETVLKDVSKDEKGFAFMSSIIKVLGETLDQTSASAS